MKYDVKKMLQIALAARQQAYAPYSKFPVGVCIVSQEGQYYGGCNVENSAYPMGHCAETTAIGNMILAGSHKIIAVLTVTDTPHGVLPCGGCMQKLSEFIMKDADVISASLAGELHIQKFDDIFKSQFSQVFSQQNNINLSQ